MRTRLSVKTDRRRVRPPTTAAFHRRHFVPPLVAVAALLAGAAGCGGDDETLSKPEVIKRGSAICRAGEEKVTGMSLSEDQFAKDAPERDREKAQRFLAIYADSLQAVRKQLGDLKLPEEDKEKLEGFIADLGPTVKRFRQAERALAEGDPKSAAADANEAFGLFAKASEKTAAYGFPKGVCGSGGSG